MYCGKQSPALDTQLFRCITGYGLRTQSFAGKIYAVPDTNRFTMYHLPHSTMVGGVMLVYGGDDRILNNIFIGQSIENKHRGVHGTKAYENYSHSAAPKTMDNDTPAADIGRTLPMTIQNNVYLNKAENWTHEKIRVY